MKFYRLDVISAMLIVGSLTLTPIVVDKVFCQSRAKKSKEAAVTRMGYRRPFRYIIYLNEVGEDNGPQERSRYLEVLLDRKAYSEKTLRELFHLLSERFPEPVDMDVQVFTSIEQVPTPEEMGRGASEQPDNPWVEKHPSAFMIRRSENEIIRYFYRYPYRVEKTIVIKGEDLINK